MATRKKSKKETYFKCKKCGDEIYSNTHKKMIHCKCGAIAVDGCEDYIRLIGDKNDYQSIKKNFPNRLTYQKMSREVTSRNPERAKRVEWIKKCHGK